MVTAGKNFTAYISPCFLFCKAFNCGGQSPRPALFLRVCARVWQRAFCVLDVCLFRNLRRPQVDHISNPCTGKIPHGSYWWSVGVYKISRQIDRGDLEGSPHFATSFQGRGLTQTSHRKHLLNIKTQNNSWKPRQK